MSIMQLQQVLLCFSVLFVIVSSTGQCKNHKIDNSTEKLKIKILYEPLCSDSYKFILRQLKPTWEKIADYVDVTFVPFGKSSSLENGTKFICQHGSAECRGNRIMSCVLNEITDQTMQVNYVVCFMRVYYTAGRLNSNEYGKQCADGIDFDKVLKCYRTKQGTMHQLQAEIDTKEFIGPQTNFVPTIIYNGVFNQTLQDNSLTNMYDVVCGTLSNTHPSAC